MSEIGIYICEYFQKEVNHFIDEENISGIRIHVFGHSHMCHPMTNNKFDSIIKNSQDDHLIFLSGCVTSELVKQYDQHPVIHIEKLNSCFSLFCGQEKINQFNSEGAYIVTPGWLLNWKDWIANTGFDKQTACEFFKESCRKIVFLDTGVDTDSEKKMIEFSTFVNLPYETYWVGLDYFKLFLRNKINEKRILEYQQSLNNVSQQIAEREMIIDLVGQLSNTYDEEVLGSKIIELFFILYAAQECAIVIYNENNNAKIYGNGISEVSEIISIQKSFEQKDESYLMTDSGSGFNILIHYSDEKIGFLHIDKVPYKEHLQKYLNLAISITPILGMVYINVRKYKEIKKVNQQQELIVKISEMFLNSDKKKDEFKEVVNLIHQFIGFDAVGIRLKDNKGCFYKDTIGFDKDFLEKENSIIPKSVLDKKKDSAPSLECVCGAVISGMVQKLTNKHTVNGSFWTNSAEELLNSELIKNLPTNVRGTCLEKGYNSIAWIPILSQDGIVGLLQFNDYRKNVFNKEIISFLERIAITAGIGISRKLSIDALHDAKQKAEEANKAKSEFLANMSHEIRTPLNAITGFSELLTSIVTDEKQRSYISSIKNAGRSLLTLINDILDLSKIEAGMLQFEYSWINLDTLFKEIDSIFRGTVMEKKLNFFIDINEDIPNLIRIDEARLRQVLLNLVGNAIKFTEKGFVCLKASYIEDIDNKRCDLKISVQDTGIGIRRSDKEMIFESFRQQEGQSNRKYGGTGLGLSISKRLVEMMNGNMSVESEEGKGSQFNIIIKDVKIADGSFQSRSDEHVDYKYLKFNNPTVLIVDDIKSNRDPLRDLLILHNVSVVEADNGEDAVNIAQNIIPDLIIMDIRMPVMDGREATAKLKAIEVTSQIPIIALSASVSKKEIDNKNQYSYSAFLTKPLNVSNLLTEMMKHLSFSNKEPEKDTIYNNDDIPLEPDEILKFYEILKNEIVPQYANMVKVLNIKKLEEFYTKMSTLSKKYPIGRFIDLNNTLDVAIKSFDVIKIRDVKKLLIELQTLLALKLKE